MAKWELEKDPEMIPVPLDSRHFKQLLAEIAELLVSSYCQLQQIKIKSQSIGIPSSLKSSKLSAAERLGSHE